MLTRRPRRKLRPAWKWAPALALVRRRLAVLLRRCRTQPLRYELSGTLRRPRRRLRDARQRHRHRALLRRDVDRGRHAQRRPASRRARAPARPSASSAGGRRSRSSTARAPAGTSRSARSRSRSPAPSSTCTGRTTASGFEVVMKSGTVVVRGSLTGAGIPLHAGQRLVASLANKTLVVSEVARPSGRIDAPATAHVVAPRDEAPRARAARAAVAQAAPELHAARRAAARRVARDAGAPAGAEPRRRSSRRRRRRQPAPAPARAARAGRCPIWAWAARAATRGRCRRSASSTPREGFRVLAATPRRCSATRSSTTRYSWCGGGSLRFDSSFDPADAVVPVRRGGDLSCRARRSARQDGDRPLHGARPVRGGVLGAHPRGPGRPAHRQQLQPAPDHRQLVDDQHDLPRARRPASETFQSRPAQRRPDHPEGRRDRQLPGMVRDRSTSTTSAGGRNPAPGRAGATQPDVEVRMTTRRRVLSAWPDGDRCSARPAPARPRLQPKAIAAPTTPPRAAQSTRSRARASTSIRSSRRMVARATAPTPEDAARLKKVATLPDRGLAGVARDREAGRADAGRRAQAGGGGRRADRPGVRRLQPPQPRLRRRGIARRAVRRQGRRGAATRAEFIDVIAAAFAAHPSQKIAVVLEPDSLANLVTNIEVPTCAAAEQIYRRGIAYAISKLSLPNVFIYLDGAHAGWLGWPKNLPKAVAVFKEVLAQRGRRGSHPRLRGQRVELRSAARAEGEEERPRRPEPGRARLRRRSGGRPRQGRHHRQGVHHRHQPQRQGRASARRPATGATSRARASASARPSRRRRTSTPTSGSRRRANPTAPPIARRRASTRTASPTTPCPAPPRPASCSRPT